MNLLGVERSLGVHLGGGNAPTPNSSRRKYSADIEPKELPNEAGAVGEGRLVGGGRWIPSSSSRWKFL